MQIIRCITTPEDVNSNALNVDTKYKSHSNKYCIDQHKFGTRNVTLIIQSGHVDDVTALFLGIVI